MSANFHNELNRGSCQEFIGTKGTSASVGRDPIIFWLSNNNILISFFVRKLYWFINAGQVANNFKASIEFRIGYLRNRILKFLTEYTVGSFS
jgi:hypothetical protein